MHRDSTIRQVTVHERTRADERSTVPLILVVDRVRSALNVGSLFRTADAFGIERIVLCGIAPTPPHRDIRKTALGADEVVPWTHVEQTAGAVRDLVDRGVEVWALETAEPHVRLADWRPMGDGPVALVVGHEVDGISQDVLDLCTGSIEIDQVGTKHSLNVAVSAGVGLWQVAQVVRSREDIHGAPEDGPTGQSPVDSPSS